MHILFIASVAVIAAFSCERGVGGDAC